ncbi:MAG: cupin domain-containing protein [Gaiellaceae bacterium]
MGLSHWDDVDRHRRAKGEMDAEWQFLGRAAGTAGVGVNRVRVPPGKLPTPPHSHGASEEIFYVLDGSGLAWQDGDVHEVGPRDCVIHRADEHEHTFVAGANGLEYLVFGTRHPTEIGWLPRSRAIRIGWPWVEGRDDDPWDVEATVPPLEITEPKPRPENIVNVDEVEHEPWRDQVVTAPLAVEERSHLAGFHWERILPGKTGSVPHCHSEEEEIFVILEGSATLHLWPSPLQAERGAGREEHELRPGHLVARPPGTGVSHWFRAGDDGCTMLIYGTRRPNDMCFYPRSNKISWRGLGVIGRIEHVPYWDGESDE